ncbi:hypothetical protein CR513_27933, partial [Mucuna pruriens]
MVNEIGAVDNLRLKNQLTKLTSLVRQLAVSQHQPSMVATLCGICTSMEHPTDMCPKLQEIESDHPESVGAIAISARVESRAICRLTIWNYPECTSSSRGLSTTESAIPGATVPTTATTDSATSRQLTISGRPDEAVGNKQFGVSAKHELQQYAIPTKYECHHPRPQDTNWQLANTVGHLHSVRSGNLPSQTILNPRGNASAITLRSGRELPQVMPQQEPRPTDTNFEPDANSQVPQEKYVQLPFPTRTLTARKSETDEELLRMF